jgi:hypothetical protein
MTTSCLPRRQFLELIGLAGTAAALGLPAAVGAPGLSLADIKGWRRHPRCARPARGSRSAPTTCMPT